MNATGSPCVDSMKHSPPGRIPDDVSSDLSVGVVVPVFNEAGTLDYYLSRLYEGIFHSPRSVLPYGRFFTLAISGGRGLLRRLKNALRAGADLGEEVPAARDGAAAVRQHFLGRALRDRSVGGTSGSGLPTYPIGPAWFRF